MTRFLTTTAIGLLLGLAPAFAETQAPTAAETVPALQQPAEPSAPSDPSAAMPANPADPANPMASQVPPEVMAPAPSATPPQSSEAPKSISPEQSATAEPEVSPFLVKQDASELLAANLIGQTVLDANNDSIGEVTDLITDKDGKIRAVLIGAGGFLGIGEKDLAIRFEDIKVARDENDDLIVKADVTKEMVAQAPDYQTLDEQQMIVGEKSDREENSQ
jgi:sporulation protein YlmC with PRC-barrel domain